VTVVDKFSLGVGRLVIGLIAASIIWGVGARLFG
jgi:hypothetical protein